MVVMGQVGPGELKRLLRAMHPDISNEDAKSGLGDVKIKFGHLDLGYATRPGRTILHCLS